MHRFDTRYVEDIAPVTQEVTRLIYQHGRCCDCGKLLRHPDALSGPEVITGPNLAAHLAMLNHMGMTFGKLSALSTNTFGIELSPAGALGIVKRVGNSLRGPYNELLGALPKQDWLNGDETGWKIMGKAGYIWCFCNSTIALFHHDESRASRVVEQILGTSFPGIVICDFYGAYNCVGRTQRCLMHLLRDIAKEREILSGSKLLKRFEKAVKGFIQRGLDVQAMQDGPAKEKAVAALGKRLDGYRFLIEADHPGQITEALKSFHLGTAHDYRSRKGWSGPLWRQRGTGITLVETGPHALRCALDMDFQMVRLDDPDVFHPLLWKHSGHMELAEIRKRYRLLDRDAIRRSLMDVPWPEFREWYIAASTDRWNSGEFGGETWWDTALMVGSQQLCETVADTQPTSWLDLKVYPALKTVRGLEDTMCWTVSMSKKRTYEYIRSLIPEEAGTTPA